MDATAGDPIPRGEKMDAVLRMPKRYSVDSLGQKTGIREDQRNAGKIGKSARTIATVAKGSIVKVIRVLSNHVLFACQDRTKAICIHTRRYKTVSLKRDAIIQELRSRMTIHNYCIYFFFTPER